LDFAILIEDSPVAVGSVLFVCRTWWIMSGGGVGVRRSVVHASAVCPGQRCIGRGEAGHFPRV